MDKFEKREGGSGAVRKVGGGRGGGRRKGGRVMEDREKQHTHTHRKRVERDWERGGRERGKREREEEIFSEHCLSEGETKPKHHLQQQKPRKTQKHPKDGKSQTAQRMDRFAPVTY